jgi:hypothetical protein
MTHIIKLKTTYLEKLRNSILNQSNIKDEIEKIIQLYKRIQNKKYQLKE